MNNGSVQVQGSLKDLIDAKVNLTQFIVQGQDDEDIDEDIAALTAASTVDNELQDTAPSPTELASRKSK